MGPGMPPLQLSASSSASSALSQQGSSWDLGFGGGSWTANVAGSGQANQAASASSSPSWLLPVVVVGALCALSLLRRR